MSQWYYAQDNQQQGPINEAELKEFLATGKLASSVLVWKEGMDNWTTAGSLPEFQFRPPPMPSASKPTPPVTPPPAATSSSAATAAAGIESDELDPEDVNKNKPFALLSYLGILFIIPMIVAKESPYAKYHANQGLILFLAWLIVSIGISILHSIPFVGIATVALWPLLYVAWLIFVVIGILNAAKGEKKPLPFIGDYTIYS